MTNPVETADGRRVTRSHALRRSRTGYGEQTAPRGGGGDGIVGPGHLYRGGGGGNPTEESSIETSEIARNDVRFRPVPAKSDFWFSAAPRPVIVW